MPPVDLVEGDPLTQGHSEISRMTQVLPCQLSQGVLCL